MNHMISPTKAGDIEYGTLHMVTEEHDTAMTALQTIKIVDLPDATATERLGEDISLVLKPGDVVALLGDLGAGKTTLARAAIRAITGDDEQDVPSPTFTLVQSYTGRLPVSHLDLYRLADASEMDELGLDEALATGAILVEWPQKVDSVLARANIIVELQTTEPGGRRAAIAASGDAIARIERTLEIRDFLSSSGMAGNRRKYYIGDASSRRYETIDIEGGSLVLMDSPNQPDGPPIRDGLPYSRLVHLAEDVRPFVAVARALGEAGFCAPRIREQNLDRGLLLTSNLGTGSLLRADRTPDPERYRAAVECLARMHEIEWRSDVPIEADEVHHVARFDADAMMTEANLLIDWYVPEALGRQPTDDERDRFHEAWSLVFQEIADAETTLVLRDFHSPNIIWQPDAIGTARIGLIDFQDALIGPTAYDVASLAQDARVNVPPELEASLVSAYVAARRASDPDFKPFLFERDYAVMAAQRATKVLGIFVRLSMRDGKPQYRRHIPHVRGYLGRALDHPTLAAVKSLYADWGIVGNNLTSRRA
ncbi:tRNA (adenosine(37)-N6)-threonylcarbamoyltransferase complex ATPase subunit type 1 TsaE [Fulvimarina sp. MAC3]|uniref:tRNA (adenosine(37)-N6)-threonylcarbamoyltransferase complex ATPase subunit type 1 TsaE n=1 Tax=Fulvimarina sp. MAC3 TaxID=3148887 RepID=UPI0031FBE9E4